MNVEMAHETAEEPEQEEELAEPAPAQEEYKEETAVSPVAVQPHQPSTDNAGESLVRKYSERSVVQYDIMVIQGCDKYE